MAYVKCTKCGQSDGDDDEVISREMVDVSGDILDVLETRKCDICGNEYHVLLHYKFLYEEQYDYLPNKGD